jgi:hypothetical protein
MSEPHLKTAAPCGTPIHALSARALLQISTSAALIGEPEWIAMGSRAFRFIAAEIGRGRPARPFLALRAVAVRRVLSGPADLRLPVFSTSPIDFARTD